MTEQPIKLHSRKSFSARKRYAACPASVPLSANLPDSESDAAREGTLAHSVAEFHLLTRLKRNIDEPVMPEWLHTDPIVRQTTWELMHDHGEAYAKDILERTGYYRTTTSVVVEQRVGAPSLDPELFGTADCLVWCAPDGTLYVFDYKYGHASVDIGTAAAPNQQLEAYAISAIETGKLEPKTVVLIVNQPREHHGDKIKTLTLDVATWLPAARERLAREAQAVNDAIAAHERGEKLTTTPGDHCHYCLARKHGKCSSQWKALETIFKGLAAQKTVLDYPEADVVAFYAAKKLLEGFIEDIDERIKNMAQAGSALLVRSERQGRRIWADSEGARDLLVASGRFDCLTVGPISEVADLLPAELSEILVTRARPSTIIKPAKEHAVSEIANTFAKYAAST